MGKIIRKIITPTLQHSITPVKFSNYTGLAITWEVAKNKYMLSEEPYGFQNITDNLRFNFFG